MPRRPAARATPPHPARPSARAGPAEIPLRHPAFVAVLLVAAVCMVVDVSYLITTSDFWQHLAVGREIVRRGSVPTTQIWTWPTYGRPDVTPSWLFRVLLWSCYAAWSTAGLFVWRWVGTLLAFGIAWWTGRRMGARGLLPLVVVAWAALFYRMRAEPRPESLVYVLIALQVLIHESVRRSGDDRPPWRSPAIALPVIALLWANVHISYWLGLLLQAIYFGDACLASIRRPARRAWLVPLALLGVASGAVSFLNPGGVATLAQPFEYWLEWRHELIFRQIGELEPLRLAENVRNLLWLFVAGWPLLILLRMRRHGVDFAEIAIGAVAFALSFGSVRFLGNLAVLAVPFVARDLAEVLEGVAPPAWARSPWARAAVVATLCVAGSAAEWTSPFNHSGLGVSPLLRPRAACDFIERTGIRGRCFNHYEFGGYLLFRFPGQHDRLPFMDIHATGTREDRRLFAQSFFDADSWVSLDRKYRFDWVLLDRFRSQQDLSMDHLDADSAYALVFLDDVSALYVRKTGPLRPIAERFAYHVLHGGTGSAAAITAATMDSTERPALRMELRRMERESPVHASALSIEANTLYREGRLEAVRDTLRAALAIDDGFPQATTRLAQVDLKLGRAREAEIAAQHALFVDGENESTREVLVEARALRREGGPLTNVIEPLPKAALPYAWPRGD